MAEEQNKSKKKYLIIIVILAILTITLGVMQFLNTTEIQEKEETVSALEFEQLQLQNDLQDMLIQYDTLTVKNDRLNAEIIGQQEQIKEMLKEIAKHKDDAYIIAKLKKEAATLRDIMKGYLATIDSLNTLNIDLQKDNQFLVEELSETKTRAQELETSKKSLEDIVATGSVLQANNMSAIGLRVRNNGKQVEVNRARRTELIRSCTQIGENRITEAGKKTIYLRIISPDGVVLEGSDGDDNKFDFEGVSGKYSVKRSIDYKNEPMELCIFYSMDEDFELASGKYIVEMYESGMKIGTTSFDLK
ncbi:MAG: coiled-coil domain-containing protein [Cryomorphaceae bacterium]|nr:hypothetical protein [Flavobacteriales bacterium]